MTAREYLNRYREYELIAAEKLSAYNEARERIFSVASPLGSVDELHNKDYRARENRIIEAQRKREAWAEASLNAMEVRQDVFETILKLPAIEFQLLHERYILLNQWEQVAEKIGLAWTQTHRTHRKALADLQEIIDNCGEFNCV